MRRLTVVITALLLLAPAVAGAATYEVRGGGWGHGVGMSQYGAYGFALEGRGYREILRHYYQRTKLGSVGGARARVLLQASQPGSGSFSGAIRAGRKKVAPKGTYRVDASSSGKLVVRRAGGKRVGRFSAPLRVRGRNDRLQLGGTAINGVHDGHYRGRLEFHPGLYGGITAVNDVQIDDYIRGVIPAEMPASWHPQALRAQAVAARSYAMATNRGGEIFDHYPDTRSQVYGGIGVEQPSTNRAATSTAGQVVKHRGEVATTFFFSTSGGHTEHVENVFGGSRIRYLRGVKDPYDDISPRHRWTFRFTRQEMEARLGSLVNGRFRRIKPLERGASPRIVRARVIGSAGSTRVSGSSLRTLLGIYDAPRSVRRVKQKARATGATVTAAPSGTAVPRPPKG